MRQRAAASAFAMVAGWYVLVRLMAHQEALMAL